MTSRTSVRRVTSPRAMLTSAPAARSSSTTSVAVGRRRPPPHQRQVPGAARDEPARHDEPESAGAAGDQVRAVRRDGAYRALDATSVGAPRTSRAAYRVAATQRHLVLGVGRPAAPRRARPRRSLRDPGADPLASSAERDARTRSPRRGPRRRRRRATPTHRPESRAERRASPARGAAASRRTLPPERGRRPATLAQPRSAAPGAVGDTSGSTSTLAR